MRITSIKTEAFSHKLRGDHISVHFKYTRLVIMDLWGLQTVLKAFLS